MYDISYVSLMYDISYVRLMYDISYIVEKFIEGCSEYYDFWKQILCRSICLARDTTEANAACIQFIFHRFTY
jgi:hypothetical protein